MCSIHYFPVRYQHSFELFSDNAFHLLRCEFKVLAVHEIEHFTHLVHRKLQKDGIVDFVV
jgi:hypothetical protein